MRLVRTSDRNVQMYKDRYCAKYKIGEKVVFVNIMNKEVTINGERFVGLNEDDVKTVHWLCGVDSFRLTNVSRRIVDFLIESNILKIA